MDILELNIFLISFYFTPFGALPTVPKHAYRLKLSNIITAFFCDTKMINELKVQI